MKEKLINEIKTAMRTVITADQMSILCNVLNRTLQNIVIAEKLPDANAIYISQARRGMLRENTEILCFDYRIYVTADRQEYRRYNNNRPTMLSCIIPIE